MKLSSLLMLADLEAIADAHETRAVSDEPETGEVSECSEVDALLRRVNVGAGRRVKVRPSRKARRPKQSF